MINLLASKFAQIATAIDATTAQITALQAKLSELQEHQQQLQSVEQACQSALSQVDTALMMLNHVDPTEINTFKDAIDIKFNSETIALIEPTAPAETATDTPAEPIAPIPLPTPHPTQTSKNHYLSYRFKVFANLPSLKVWTLDSTAPYLL